MTDATTRGLVERLYAAAGAGDWQTAEAMLSDDLVIVEADGLPYAGTWRGKSALRDLYTVVMAQWRDPKIEIHQITVGGDAAVGLLTLTATAPATGERREFQIAEVFRVSSGLVVEIRPHYFDTAAVAAALAT